MSDFVKFGGGLLPQVRQPGTNVSSVCTSTTICSSSDVCSYVLCWQLRLILHVSTRVTTRSKVNRQAINNRITVTALAAVEVEEVALSMVAATTVRPKSVLVIKIPTSRAAFAGAVAARVRVRHHSR